MTTDASETNQADAEAPDGSDKPPHARNTDTNSTNSTNPSIISTAPSTASTKVASIPLPEPESGSYPKEPGRTRGDLEKLVLSGTEIALSNGHHDRDHAHDKAASGTKTPSTPSSPSDSEPSTRPTSQRLSRAPSMTTGVTAVPPPTKPTSATPTSTKAPSTSSKADTSATAQQPSSAAASPKIPPAPPSAPRSRASSVHSDSGHKFTLKDLLASGPKLARKASQKSAGGSSRKGSDTHSNDGDGKPGKSQAGGSQASLTMKYGVCQKVAIGKGATSVVRLAHKWDRTEEKLYAVKEFRKRRKNESEKEYVKKLTAEFCISSTLHHPNIVETVDLVQDENKKWCEVMEFCAGGDLYAAIKKGGMSPSEVECCFKQILTGVGYLHSQGVAHRDLKPENLFFDNKGHLKIGDYGASTVYRLPWETAIHMSTGLCGSEPYIAPEQFLGKPYDARLVDIWACGVVYYCLHFQELPWRVAQLSDPLYNSYAQACASPQPAQSACPPTINNLSPRACRTLIRKMLDPDPKLRSPIEEVMRHQWMEGIEVCTAVSEPKHVHVHARALAATGPVPVK